MSPFPLNPPVNVLLMLLVIAGSVQIAHTQWTHILHTGNTQLCVYSEVKKPARTASVLAEHFWILWNTFEENVCHFVKVYKKNSKTLYVAEHYILEHFHIL